jgi:sulfur carrier protein ThiS adenylyltransferase
MTDPAHTRETLRARLGMARVGIAGLGGLGSNVAWMLVRSGVRQLVLVDFDAVDETNLDRQFYFADQIGRMKADALAENLLRIAPDLDLEAHAVRITADNFERLFDGVDVFVEAVDSAEEKSSIIALGSDHLPGVPIVAASGLAGYGPANDLTTQQIAEGVYVVGDFTSGVSAEHPLVASRVTLAAAHQALLVVRLLLGCPQP